MSELSQSETFPLSRRVFLLASGGFAVALAMPDAADAAGATSKPPLKPDQLDSYLAIERDGTVTVFYGRIDGGQGLETSIAQMVADELDVSLASVDRKSTRLNSSH